MSEQEMQIKLASQQEKVKALRQEVAEMNKEREFWQHYRIQAAIAAMPLVAGSYNLFTEEDKLIKHAVKIADALIEELQKKGGEQ